MLIFIPAGANSSAKDPKASDCKSFEKSTFLRKLKWLNKNFSDHGGYGGHDYGKIFAYKHWKILWVKLIEFRWCKWDNCWIQFKLWCKWKSGKKMKKLISEYHLSLLFFQGNQTGMFEDFIWNFYFENHWVLKGLLNTTSASNSSADKVHFHKS